MKSSRHLVVLRIKTAPLNFATGEIIQDRAQQMERWVEHYPEHGENMKHWTPQSAYSCIISLLKWSWKRPWSTCTWKSARPGWWYQGVGDTLPRGKKGTTMMRDANIITLYKNKPARRDCTNNCQGIEFPSIAIKLFARVVVKGLQVLAERLYPESWCGFPAKRSILLGLIACPARRTVWSRLRRNGHKRYLHLTWLVCVCVCVRVCVLMNNKTTKE